MQGLKRKLVYVSLFETIAILASGGLFALLFDVGVAHAGGAAIAASAVAVTWNLAYNTVFEAWESRQERRGRTFGRRALHAIGFEAGLILLLVPLFAVLLGISLWQAFLLDLGTIVFFLVYTFLFNLGFDHVFGLPASALPRPPE